MSDEEPKIIIDEDWKSQVQKEREEAAQTPDEEESTPVEGEPGQDAEEGMPEASFNALVASLATQTMFALGVIAEPGTQQVMVDLDQAKFTIDLLIMLKEKTEGNLSPEEEGHLQEALAELQRVYVARVQQMQEQAMKEAGVDLGSLKQG